VAQNFVHRRANSRARQSNRHPRGGASQPRASQPVHPRISPEAHAAGSQVEENQGSRDSRGRLFATSGLLPDWIHPASRLGREPSETKQARGRSSHRAIGRITIRFLLHAYGLFYRHRREPVVTVGHTAFDDVEESFM